MKIVLIWCWDLPGVSASFAEWSGVKGCTDRSEFSPSPTEASWVSCFLLELGWFWSLLSILRRLDWWTDVAEKMAECSVCAGNFSEWCTDTAGSDHLLWWWWVIQVQRSRYILMKVVVIYLESWTLDLWEEVSLSLLSKTGPSKVYT